MYHLSEYGEHREVSSPRVSPPSPLRPHVTIIIRYYIKRPSNARILVGFHSWTVEGQTFRWRHYQQYFASLSYHPKPKGSTLSSVWSETNHSRRQNVVRTSVTHSAVLHVPLFFLFALWPHLCSVTEQKHGNMESICLPFSPYEWLASNFSLLCRPWIKHESHENRGDDHQLKQLSIV